MDVVHQGEQQQSVLEAIDNKFKNMIWEFFKIFTLNWGKPEQEGNLEYIKKLL